MVAPARATLDATLADPCASWSGDVWRATVSPGDDVADAAAARAGRSKKVAHRH